MGRPILSDFIKKVFFNFGFPDSWRDDWQDTRWTKRIRYSVWFASIVVFCGFVFNLPFITYGLIIPLLYLMGVGSIYNIYKVETPSFPKYFKIFFYTIWLLFVTFIVAAQFFHKFI